MKTIIFDHGFSCEINEAVLTDWDLSVLIGKITELEEDGSAGARVKTAPMAERVFLKLLGAKQYEDLKESVRDDSGTVQAEKMVGLLEELFTKAGDEVKN